MTADPFGLHRFVAAQEPVMEAVRRDLGRSPTALHFGLSGLAEARAYLAHPVLGPRLEECAALVNAHCGRSAHAILGSPDDVKLHASMTLFALARPGASPFQAALEGFFGGQPHAGTMRLLEG
jgi:uncharacterized protein (DUF1810 family)